MLALRDMEEGAVVEDVVASCWDVVWLLLLVAPTTVSASLATRVDPMVVSPLRAPPPPPNSIFALL